jgi:hypothetical protein
MSKDNCNSNNKTEGPEQMGNKGLSESKVETENPTVLILQNVVPDYIRDENIIVGDQDAIEELSPNPPELYNGFRDILIGHILSTINERTARQKRL